MLEAAITSPWVYLVVFAVALLDAFFPLVPSEATVITAGVFAAHDGEPILVAVIAAAAIGAFIGDHVSYWIGNRTGTGIGRRLNPGTRLRSAFDWAARALAARGGSVLVVARYIPGGRTAATLTMGAMGYPRLRFAAFDAIAAASWAVYATALGYLGGAAVVHDPLKGMLLGFALATIVTVAAEVLRRVRRIGPSAASGVGGGRDRSASIRRVGSRSRS